MKFKLFILLLFFSLNTFAQCCCGRFYFRIIDSRESKIYPSISDTLKMNIDPKLTDLGYWKQIDGKKLPATKLQAKTIQTKGNAGTSQIDLSKSPFTDLLFEFSTGCFTQLKKISFTKGDKKMILNLIDIPSETIILMDSIPFVEGELTYNITKIVRNNKECEYENLPDNKFYLHYRIPYNLIKLNAPSQNIQEIKNDTMYYYADSLKTKLVAKGKIKVRKKNVKYYSKFDMRMKKEKRVFNLKRGTWIYYYENSELRKAEYQKPYKPRKRKNGYRHIRLEETGF